ncbi:SRPBCC family protein [Streptosporangium sp. KLBMP 9127]|nr:SRPBCC family protein [Streptosporangium sp. KLBMP 9127]
MSTIEHSVDVRVPVRTAYNQWTQFESFPEFMEGVQSVKQLDDTRTAWVVEIAGVRREFEAEIAEQLPDRRVAWRSEGRPHQAGVVTFHRIDDGNCRVMLQMDFDPEGAAETAGDWLQVVRLRVRGDLERFKRFIESRGGETGAWRGAVRNGSGAVSGETGGVGGETGAWREAGGRRPGDDPPAVPGPIA